MKNATLAILVALSVTACGQNSGFKPGLWEIKPIRHVVDGRDMTAQVLSDQAKRQQEMAARMPPDQQNLMGHPAVFKAGGMRICISPARAAKGPLIVDPEGRCEPDKEIRSGNKSNFEFNCTFNGMTMVGKGESVTNDNIVTNNINMTATNAQGSHTMQSASQMNYLGTDCQGIRPLEQLVRTDPGLSGK